MKIVVKKSFQKDLQKTDKHILLVIKEFILFSDIHTWEEVKQKYNPVKLQ